MAVLSKHVLAWPDGLSWDWNRYRSFRFACEKKGQCVAARSAGPAWVA